MKLRGAWRNFASRRNFNPNEFYYANWKEQMNVKFLNLVYGLDNMKKRITLIGLDRGREERINKRIK